TGQVRADLGQPAKAPRAYPQGIRIDEKLLGPDHPNLASYWLNRANVLGDSGDHLRAIAEYARVERSFERVNAEHPDLAIVYINAGSEYEALGRRDEARDRYLRAYRLTERTVGEG